MNYSKEDNMFSNAGGGGSGSLFLNKIQLLKIHSVCRLEKGHLPLRLLFRGEHKLSTQGVWLDRSVSG